MPKQLISEMNLAEAEERIANADAIIIPLGAESKEHGLHMPMNTDYIMANRLRDLLLAKMPNVIAAATIGTSYFPAFEEYPGSITLELNTATDMIIQTCRSLNNHGAKCFYFLNTGISTLRALKVAQEELAKEKIHISFLNLIDFEQTTHIKNELKIDEIGTHANDVETSMMLFLAPEIVQMDKAIDNDCPDKPGLTRDINSPDKLISIFGVWGKPQSATKEKGKVIVTKLIDYIQNSLNVFIEEQRMNKLIAKGKITNVKN